eukprot:scaffold24693_cov39-Prasinocladus_malaysianus.AAC.1
MVIVVPGQRPRGDATFWTWPWGFVRSSGRLGRCVGSVRCLGCRLEDNFAPRQRRGPQERLGRRLDRQVSTGDGLLGFGWWLGGRLENDIAPGERRTFGDRLGLRLGKVVTSDWWLGWCLGFVERLGSRLKHDVTPGQGRPCLGRL